MLGWKDFLKNTVLKPGLERLGTVLALWLVWGGDWACRTFEMCGLVTQDGAALVINYVVAVALLLFDVIYIHAERIKGGGKR